MDVFELFPSPRLCTLEQLHRKSQLLRNRRSELNRLDQSKTLHDVHFPKKPPTVSKNTSKLHLHSRKVQDNGMSEEDHYDTPWEFLARPTSVRLSSADIRYSISPKNRDNLTKSPSITSQLAHINNSPPLDDPKRLSLRERVTKVEHHHPLHQQQHFRRRDEEDYILEKNVDRVEAEKRLEARATGDFLLRLRGEGSAALSLRGSAGILHIKLERRGEKWIIGDGPCFRSITSAINYYQRHPLPIRGADHLLLRQPVSSVLRF